MLTIHRATFVDQLVSSGRYRNASEVLGDGLRFVEQREAEDASRLVALRSAVKDMSPAEWWLGMACAFCGEPRVKTGSNA